MMAQPNMVRFYVGTYTHDNDSQGIYLAEFDPATGALALLGAGPFVANPSYVVIHPQGHRLYAVNELTGADRPLGAVSALAIAPDTGAMTLLNQESTLGTEPCHVSIDASGRMVMAANYAGGSVCAFPVRADGSLGPASSFQQHVGAGVDPRRQAGPLGHSIWPDPSNRWALACDKGLDKVLIYAMDPARGTLMPARQAYARGAPGAGPRHLAFHPNGRWCYVLNEIRSSVACFDWDAERGALTEFAHVPALPEEFTARNAAADIHLTPDGRFLYASNRGQNALAMFAVGEAGELTLLGYEPTRGDHPRNFAIAPGGQWLLAANMRSNSIVAFRLDRATGQLAATGHELSVPSPTCIQFWQG